MAMTPWEPFEDLMPLRDAMSRLIEESFIGPRRLLEPFARVFPVDVREMDDRYVVEASLPGVKADEIEISAEENVLTIRVARKQEEETKKAGKYIRHERYEGEVRRSVALPTFVDADKVTATYEHGVLSLEVPKVEAPKAKHITVQVKEPATAQGLAH